MKISFWILLLYGILHIIAGIYTAHMHGKPKGNYNGVCGVLNALIGVVLILIAYNVIP